MKAIALIALLLGLAGWALFMLTGMNLLSGPLEERTCQTACVQTYFFAAVAAGLIGFALGALATLRPPSRVIGVASLVLTLPLCGVFATLFVIGNYGNLIH